MNCSNIVKKYLMGLHDKITIEEGDRGCIVHTPFLNPDNERIMAFVEKTDEGFRISDMSQTDEFLFLHGLDIKQFSTANYYFKDILKRYGVNWIDAELSMVVDEEHLTTGINSVIGAITSMDHLIFTLNPRLLLDDTVEEENV